MAIGDVQITVSMSQSTLQDLGLACSEAAQVWDGSADLDVAESYRKLAKQLRAARTASLKLGPHATHRFRIE